MELAPYKGGSGPGGYERVYINHKDRCFWSSDDFIANGYDNAKSLDIIMLGIIGNRAFWPRKKKSEVDDTESIKADLAEDMKNKGPYCTSPNGYDGYPRAHFPWSDYAAHNSGFARRAENLECLSCPFTKWDDDTSGYPCQARYYVPFVTAKDASSPIRVLDFTQSGITQVKAFVSPILNKNKFLFEEWTNITLKTRENKGREFTVPSFKHNLTSAHPPTPGDQARLAMAWREAREALSRPPSTGGGTSKLTGLQMGS